MNNPFVVTGMICIWCNSFLPEENFKHKYIEGEYFKTCKNCRPRPRKTIREDEWKKERKEYKCECGSVLYLTENKHNRKQQIESHNKTIKHNLYENNKYNYDEYIKNKIFDRKKKQSEYQKKWKKDKKTNVLIN